MKRSIPIVLLLVFLSGSLLTSCAKKSIVRLDETVLAKERERIAAEKAAAREALKRELLGRNVSSRTPSDTLWRGFRKTFPYHSQVLALSDASAEDASRTLIISEPPPNLDLGDILIPTRDVLLNHAINQQSIGHDGWVKDVVLAVKGSEQQIASSLSSLNQLLFSTSYKSYILPLPARAPSLKAADLDLKVTTVELRQWTIDQAETFVPVEGGSAMSLAAVFSQSESSVYFTGTPGLVGWWIPKGKDIQTCRVEIREFALDSDLIVGALANTSGMLILGRERIVPVEVLPPLRIETISLLAAVQNGQQGELKQSYERNHLFAGRMEGNKDWAPILLSPELVDTEYGSLLNITDQLLKSWSNNGDTQYDNFHYPRPSRWPFQGRPLMTRLNTDELTYNWNTKGAGYTVKSGEYSLLALNRSGALPISYKPEGTENVRSQEVTATENEAYDYFAGLSDPNLVRVVQYAALYQIFSAFDIAKPSQSVSANAQPDLVLDRLTKELVAEVRNASSEERSKLAQQLVPKVSQQLASNSMVQALINHEMRTAANDLRAQGITPGSEFYESLLAGARAQMVSNANQQVTTIRNGLLPRIKNQLDQLDESGSSWSGDEDAAVQKIALSELATLRKLPERYAEEIARDAKSWIHTPVVVVSNNTGGHAFSIEIGGHNLDAKVTSFSVREEVAIGRPEVQGDGSIIVNPRDAERVSELVRTAGLAEGQSPETISAALQSALKSASERSPRARQVALNLPEYVEGRGGLGPPTINPPQGSHQSLGWGRFRLQKALSETELAALRESRLSTPESILVSRDPDGAIRVFHDENGGPIQAYTMEDATDIVMQLLRKNRTDGGSLKLDLRGFKHEDGTAFIKSCEIRATDEKIPREISALLFDGSLEEVRLRKFEFSKAEIRDGGVEVLPTGEQRSTILVDVPATENAQITGKTKIELIFEKQTPKEIISGLTQMIRDAIAKVIRQLGEKLDMLTFNRAVNLEIKRISRETGIEIKIIRQQFNAESRDLHFVRKDQPFGDPSPECSAGWSV
jgi:hypothetical protein